MKALVLQKPLDLVERTIPAPEAGPDEVLVRVTHTGICGTDLKIFTGRMPAASPVIMGHEIVGDLVRTSSVSADAPTEGSRVLIDPVLFCGVCAHCRAGRTHLCPRGAVIGREVNGGFADFTVAPATHVHALPPSVEARHAPLIQVLTTVVHAQRRATIGVGRHPPLELDRSVLVLGLGVSGQLHVQLAKAWGAAVVIGVSRSEWKRALAERLGADATAPAGDAARKAVQDVTNGLGADLIIDTTGVVGAIADAIGLVRPGGTIVLFGIYTDRVGELPFYDLYYKEPIVIGARAALPEDFPESIALVASGRIALAPLVTHTLPLSELRQALQMLERDDDGRMKIILENP